MKKYVVRSGAAAMTLASVVTACRSSNAPADSRPAAVRVTLAQTEPQMLPVSPPETSALGDAVQNQIRTRYSSLEHIRADAAATNIDRSDAYGELGKILMAVEYFDAAAPCLLNAQALAPGDARWPYYLGHLYKVTGAPVKAKAAFERVLQLRPDDLPALISLGDTYLADGHAETAAPLFSKALSLQPRSAAALYGLGRAALAREDYRTAVNHLEEALMLDARARGIHYPLAMAYRGLGDAAVAEAHVRKRGDVEPQPADPLMQELKELPQSPTAYELRGVRALNSRDWSGAVESFRKGLELSPDNPSLRQRLGTALFVMGDADAAWNELEQVVKTSPRYAKAHYSLGVIMEGSGRMQEAVDRFAMAVKYEPSYLEAHVRLAALLRRSGRLQESLQHSTRALDIDPRIAEASYEHSMALIGLRRYREALDRLNDSASSGGADLAVLAHARARLLAAAPDDGVRDGRKALAIMESLPDAQRRLDLGETMAMTYAELGQYEPAAEWQRSAIAAALKAGQPQLAQRMARNLQLYETRKPCRTPWRAEDPP